MECTAISNPFPMHVQLEWRCIFTPLQKQPDTLYDCACLKLLYCLKYCWGNLKPCSSTDSVLLLRLRCYSPLLSSGLIRFCQHDKNIFIIFQDCRAFSLLYLAFPIFVPWTQAQSKSLLFFFILCAIVKKIWLDKEFVPKVTIGNCSVVIYCRMLYVFVHTVYVCVLAYACVVVVDWCGFVLAVFVLFCALVKLL